MFTTFSSKFPGFSLEIEKINQIVKNLVLLEEGSRSIEGECWIGNPKVTGSSPGPGSKVWGGLRSSEIGEMIKGTNKSGKIHIFKIFYKQ